MFSRQNMAAVINEGGTVKTPSSNTDNTDNYKRNISALSTPEGNPKAGKVNKPGGISFNLDITEISAEQDDQQAIMPADIRATSSPNFMDMLDFGEFGSLTSDDEPLTEEEQSMERVLTKIFPRILLQMLNNKTTKGLLGATFNAYMEPIKQEISTLTQTVGQLKLDFDKKLLELDIKQGQVDKLEAQLDSVETHRRRKTLKLYGIPEEKTESTRTIVVDIAEKLGVDLTRDDIKRSHRTGRPKQGKPRPIMIKFVEIEVKRRLYKTRTKFRKENMKKETYNDVLVKDIYLNEDLSPFRNNLLFECRKLCASKILHSSWSFESQLYIKTTEKGLPIQIKAHAELDPYRNSMALNAYNPGPL